MGMFYLKQEYDKELDLLFLYPIGHLENEVDCIAMHDAWVAMHAKQEPNSYFIAVMDMFSVAPAAMEDYLRYVSIISAHNHGTCVVVDVATVDSRAVAESIDTMNGDVFFAGNIDEGVALLNKIRASRGRKFLAR